MTVTVHILYNRKPGLSFTDFRIYNEDKHIPYIKEVVGDVFPLSHSRSYVQRDENDNATVFSGSATRITFDAQATLVFRDEAHLGAMIAKTSQPEIAAKLKEDEAKFLDHETMVIFPMVPGATFTP